MISLFSIDNSIIKESFNTTNKWLSVNKCEKNTLTEHLLNIEKIALFRQGIDTTKIDIIVTDIESYLNNDNQMNRDGNKYFVDYTFIIPILIDEPEKIYINSNHNGVFNCLIVNFKKDVCVGFKSKNSELNSITSNSKNKFLFVHFANQNCHNSVCINDTIKENNLFDSFNLKMLNKTNIETITIEEKIRFSKEYTDNYVQTKDCTLILFKNCDSVNCFNMDTQNIDYTDSILFQDNHIYNHFFENLLFLYVVGLPLHKSYFKTKHFVVNQIFEKSNDMDKYIITLVKQYYHKNNNEYKNNVQIAAVIGKDKPKGTIIAIPLKEDNEDDVQSDREPNIFTKEKKIFYANENRFETTITSIYIIEDNPHHLYFFHETYDISFKSKSREFCFITIKPLTDTDNKLFLKSEDLSCSDISNISQENYILTQIPDKHYICKLKELRTDSDNTMKMNYVENTLREENDIDLNEILLKEKNIVVSDNYFDLLSDGENETLYDVINYKKYVNTDIVQIIAENLQEPIVKELFINISPKICDYYNLNTVNVKNVEIIDINGCKCLTPPINHVYICIFIDDMQDMIVRTNTCLEFTPNVSIGSVLAFTYKKYMNFKTTANRKVLVYNVEFT